MLGIMCLCDAYEKELDESAKLIRDALGYDSQVKDVWDRRILMELINDYKRIKNERSISATERP